VHSPGWWCSGELLLLLLLLLLSQIYDVLMLEQLLKPTGRNVTCRCSLYLS
jgi:hypothetical protein